MSNYPNGSLIKESDLPYYNFGKLLKDIDAKNKYKHTLRFAFDCILSAMPITHLRNTHKIEIIDLPDVRFTKEQQCIATLGYAQNPKSII